MKHTLKSIIKGLLLTSLLFTIGCKSTKVEKMESNTENGTSSIGKYDLVVTGYDWGPGTDKIILHTDKAYSQKKVQAKDFTIIVETMIFNWGTFQVSKQAGYRQITNAYPQNNDIVLELSVHPEDPYSNPFIFGSNMMNAWQKVYNIRIKNEKLGIDICEENKRISPLADQFTMGQSKYEDITLHYASWKPENDSLKPLIIWLHGMGEGGNDPNIALLGNKVVNLITDDVQSCFGETGACVLAPQANGFWMQTTNKKDNMNSWVSDTSETVRSYYTEALFNLIDTYIKENPDIDPKHVYIGGCSNGGYMTVNMMIEYPGYFAAAYPVCEAYPDSRIDDEKLKILADQSIWFTQSKDDKTVFPENYVLPTFKRLQDIGAKDVHLTLWEHVQDTTGNFKDKKGEPYTFNGHWSWIYTLNNQCKEGDLSIFEWLSQH